MFGVKLYFVVTYGAVFLLLGGGVHLLARWKRHRAWILVVALLLLPLPLMPYERVELQTQKHRAELLPAFYKGSENTVWGRSNEPPEIFRVLSITPRQAVVYAVEACGDDPGQRVGWKMRLRKSSSGWEFEEYDAVWSDCGSAEGNTFPPYPEAREF